MKKAAIIVVTYNAERYIRPLFDSLSQLNYPKEDFGIFVVDNGSSDKTVEEIDRVSGELDFHISHGIASSSPFASGLREIPRNDIELVENKENLGFAGGNNVGMRKALDEGYDYIVLLNQDMEVDKKWLKELVKKAESEINTKKCEKCETSENAKVGIVQAMMLLWQERDKIYTTGDRLNFLGIGYSENCRVPLAKYDPKKSVMSYAGGAAVLFKREVLEKVGLFDESFFMYHEDSDLSWRARMAGYEIKLAEKAICYHDYSFKRNKRVFYWTEKNRLAFLLKNFELKTLILILPMFVVMDIGMLGYALVTGWFLEKIKAYGWFLKNLGQILRKRKEIQKARKVKDGDLKKYLVSGIEFAGLENGVLKYMANPALRVYWRIIYWLI